MSNDLDLMPPIDDGGDDLSALIKDRAPKPRSKVTTVLAVTLILLVGVLLGVPLGRASAPSNGSPMSQGVGRATTAASSDSPGSQTRVPGAFPGRGTTGIIEKVDGSTLTIRRDDGTEVTVTTSEQTQASAYAQLDIEMLEPGTAIMVVGPTSDDGAIEAERIVIGDPGFGDGTGPRP